MRFFVLLLSLFFSGAAVSQSAPLPEPEGRRLRVIVEEKFPGGNVFVGGTTGWKKKLQTPAGLILDREFGYVTPENDFKQVVIHPRPGVWRWEAADAWVQSAAKHQQVLRIHGPIGPQCSSWAEDDERTAEELEENLVAFMTALCQRYDGIQHVKWMDVVNETVLSNGQWHTARPGTGRWELPWTKLGYDHEHPLKPPLYIKRAFEIANEHAPNTDLIINQHAGMEPAMWEKVKALVPYLREQGLRVDGIGWQAHIDTGWEKDPENLKRLHALIEWSHANDLSFHVTEMNAWLRDEVKDFEQQAETFRAVLSALLEHRDHGVVTWNVWNISDAGAWRQKENLEGCLFDRAFAPKPAYYALQALLENPPAVRGPGENPADAPEAGH